MRRHWSRSCAPGDRSGDSGSASRAGGISRFCRSAGWWSLQVGHVLEPRMVINAADGARTESGSGEGILVSSATVADQAQKIRLGKAYGAIAVDMEAAAVAQGAQARGVEFGALKAISDAPTSTCPRWIALWRRMGVFIPSGLRVMWRCVRGCGGLPLRWRGTVPRRVMLFAARS